ncbi:MAG: DUF47 family protein [Chitinophagaceae bacterium]|nr:DUF47 family protein [Chitinophagaceae bacterium]
MSFNTILNFFQPRDRVFYGLFEKVVETNKVMAIYLNEFVNTSDFEAREVVLKKIENLEHQNDENTHQIFTELGRNFITPFDREDIHYLASALDDIADYIYASAKKINLYKVDPRDKGIHKMAELIEQGTEAIRISVLELRTMKNIGIITTALVKVNSLENQADEVYDTSIEGLFANENDAKEVIKKREIFHALETATDKCEDAANVIESIIIKYA